MKDNAFTGNVYNNLFDKYMIEISEYLQSIGMVTASEFMRDYETALYLFKKCANIDRIATLADAACNEVEKSETDVYQKGFADQYILSYGESFEEAFLILIEDRIIEGFVIACHAMESAGKTINDMANFFYITCQEAPLEQVIRYNGEVD